METETLILTLRIVGAAFGAYTLLTAGLQVFQWGVNLKRARGEL